MKSGKSKTPKPWKSRKFRKYYFEFSYFFLFIPSFFILAIGENRKLGFKNLGQRLPSFPRFPSFPSFRPGHYSI